jgi:Pyridoxamine 5''-phosphate oxidase.
MAMMHDRLNEKHRIQIAKAPIFFVATATADSRINLSPKGYDCFRVLGDKRVAWLDLGGSGNETQAHLTADGRITVMFCNFEQPANILRLYGTARFVMPADPEWEALVGHFKVMSGTRQIFVMDVDNVQDSCGWGVPFMTLERERDTLVKAHAQSDPAEWEARNAARTHSIDGLPVRPAERYISGEPRADKLV